MDRLFSFLLILAMGICIFLFDLFLDSNQFIFVFLSMFGICLSLVMLIYDNKEYLNELINSKQKK